MAFIINVSKPYIPSSLNIGHVETRYIISKNSDFTDILIDYTSSTVEELLQYTNSYTLTKQDILYYKVILTFSDGSFIESDINTIRYNKVSDIQVSTIFTPDIKINQSTLDVGSTNVVVETSNISFLYGSDDHIYTDWYVKTTSGDILWKKEFDEYNLTKIVIPKNVFIGHGTYVIEARHRTANDESFLGRLVVANELKENFITLNSENKLYYNTNNVLNFIISLSIYVKIQWSLRLNNDYIYKDIDIDIVNGELEANIEIDGKDLIPNKEYVLEVNIYSFDNSIHKQEFNLISEEHNTLYDRYYLNIKKYSLDMILNLPIPIPNIPGSTKEYSSKLIPMITGPNIIFFDLDIMEFNDNIITVNKIDIDEYKIDLLYNKLITQHPHYEETVNYKYKVAKRFSSHSIHNSLLDITNPTVTAGTVIDANSEERNFGYGTYCPIYPNVDAITVGKEKTDSHYYLYDYATETRINNTELTNLTQYYINVDKNNNNESQGMLHSMYIYNTDYLFIEYRGVFSKLNLTDLSVISTNDSNYINSYKTHLFQTKDSIVCIKEINSLIDIIVLDINTLNTIKAINTNLTYNNCIFVNTLDNRLLIFNNENTETSIYELS